MPMTATKLSAKIITLQNLTTLTRGTRVRFADEMTCLQQRAMQVNEMNAGKQFPKPRCKTPWPEPSTHIDELWQNRHPAYRTHTQNYMAAQRRVLFLADVRPENRFEAFEKECLERLIAPTTADSYWGSWLGTQKLLGLKPADADAQTTKILRARATAFPVNFPTPATQEQMQTLKDTYQATLPSLTAIAAFAFINGQRISDMVQIAVGDLHATTDFLATTIRRGKTIATSQPYTLWTRRGTYPTETLMQMAEEAKQQHRLFLLTTLNTEAERTQCLHVIRDMINSVADELELRSIRRGGLTHMAEAGTPIPTILLFSKHADEKMLMRYLGWGRASEHQRQQMIEVLDGTTTTLTCTERRC
jgi:integrase